MSSDAVSVSVAGNTMLMGEHSVLFGHSAICCALETRMTVTLKARKDDTVCIETALGSYRGDIADIAAGDHCEHPLSFVLSSVAASGVQKGFDLVIESGFAHDVGLGSSAAVTAATLGALAASSLADFEYDLGEIFGRSLKVVRAIQGSGSGSDLVASIFGGISAYRIDPRNITTLFGAAADAPAGVPARVPATDLLRTPATDSAASCDIAAPRLDLFYCGYKTPTPQVIAKVKQESRELGSLVDGLYSQMGKASVLAQSSVIEHDWRKLGVLMNHYHGLLDALGVCDAKLADMVYQARSNPTVLGAKISGSGLGDCIITLSEPGSDVPKVRGAVRHFQAPIATKGLVVL